MVSGSQDRGCGTLESSGLFSCKSYFPVSLILISFSFIGKARDSSKVKVLIVLGKLNSHDFMQRR